MSQTVTLSYNLFFLSKEPLLHPCRSVVLGQSNAEGRDGES